MIPWHNFLIGRGATFDDEAVVAFGPAAEELATARDAAVVCDLAPLGVLRVYGADATGFLQGQLTNDLDALAAGASHYAAWCSPKGRMLANFVVRRIDDETFELLLPHVLLTPVRKRLAMFVLRSKVALEDASAASVRLGVGGPAAPMVCAQTFGATPTLHRWMTIDHGMIGALPGPRFIVVAEPDHAAALWERLAGAARAAGFPVWQWLTIRAGVPVITPATADQFIPQMANWDALGGVSFQKGCYTGQEVVARSRYLGRLKERMVLAHVDAAAPAAAARLYSPVFADQACGTVINAATAPDGGSDLLAVLQLAASECGEVRVGALDGPALALLPLPYALPAATAPRGRIA